MSERHKINVYDAGNRTRLLGFIYADKLGPRRGRSWEFATMTMGRTWWASPDDAPEPVVRDILLDIHETVEHHGWAIRYDLVTKADLKDLLRIEAFHLPGETDREHAMRHNSYRWP